MVSSHLSYFLIATHQEDNVLEVELMVFQGLCSRRCGFVTVHLSLMMKADDTYVSASCNLIVLKFEAQILAAKVYVMDGD